MSNQRQHRSNFPTTVIIAGVGGFGAGGEWRTFTQAHHAANWLSKYSMHAPTNGDPWCRVELFTSNEHGSDITRGVVDAAAQAGVHTSRTAYINAVKAEIRNVIKEAMAVTAGGRP